MESLKVENRQLFESI